MNGYCPVCIRPYPDCKCASWVGLTDKELELLSNKWRIVYGNWVTEFAEEVEVILKEKNT